MSFNGSGTFLVNTSGQPVVSATTISSSVFNALMADLATGLSTAICKDGQTATTARIPFIFGINSSLTTDTTSGGTGSIFTAGGLGVTKAIFAGSGIIYLGGTTASEVSLKRLTTRIQARLGDDSAFCDFEAGYLLSGSAIIYLGGSTSAHVSLRRSSTTLLIRNGDNSADGNIIAASAQMTSSIITFGTASATDIRLAESGATLLVRKGDNSADAGIACGNLTTTGTVNIGGGANGTFLTSVTVTNGIVTGGT